MGIRVGPNYRATEASPAALVDAQTGLPASIGVPPPYLGAVAITPGTPVTPGVGVFIACTVAGNVRLKLSNDSTLDVPVAVGASMIDNLAVKDVVAGSTTATAVVSVLVKA